MATETIEEIPLIFPMEDYRLRIYREWDREGRRCPHNLGGWVRHYEKNNSNLVGDSKGSLDDLLGF